MGERAGERAGLEERLGILVRGPSGVLDLDLVRFFSYLLFVS